MALNRRLPAAGKEPVCWGVKTGGPGVWREEETRNQEPACLCRPPAVPTAVGTGKQSHSCRLQFQRLSLERAPGTGSVPMASRFGVQTCWGCEVQDGGLLCGRQAGTSMQASADEDAHFLGSTRQEPFPRGPMSMCVVCVGAKAFRYWPPDLHHSASHA